MSETRDDKIASLFQTLGTDTPDSIRSRAHELAATVTGATALPLAPGDTAGPYEIVGILGSGGQAVVYEAKHASLGRRVALKVPRKDVGDRLVREAKLLATLTHPAIVQVFDLSLEGRVPFLVLELCEGWSLEERLEVVAPDGLPLDQVHSVATTVLEALAYAHELGVIHRDVKPSNILFDKDHHVKVSDFGIGTIARQDELSHSAELSQASILAGTPLYVAPEQENPALREGGRLDGRADLFSFGKVLFQMLTGASPRTIRPASRLRPGLDVAWDEFIFRLTEERPERRFRTARAALFEMPKPLVLGSPKGPGGASGSPDTGGVSGVARQWIGDLRIEQELGRRLGLVVYRCRNEAAQKSVLVHVPAKNSTADFIQRFGRQATSAVRVAHPSVLRVRDVRSPQNDLPFSILDDFDGRAIAAGALAWREAVRIVAQVTQALAETHRAGIVIGEVGLKRILVNDAGDVRLVIDAPAEWAGEKRVEIGTRGELRTPYVFAPERLCGGAIDARSDIYSLGLSFYRLLTGRDPFADASSFELHTAKAYSRIVPPGPGVPTEVIRVLGKMLEPEPRRRYGEAIQLLADLTALVEENLTDAGEPSLWPGIVLQRSAGVAASALIPADAPRVGPCRVGRLLRRENGAFLHEAFHEGLGRAVRLRMLRIKDVSPRAVERFRIESQKAAVLDHPNLGRVIEQGEDHQVLYVVLDLDDGSDLAALLEQRGRLPWREATEIVLGIARGLVAAHAGIVHRDLRPENIRIGADGTVKVEGFGFARDLNSDLKLTADGAMIGTPLYMAPETGRVRETDGRVDLYSLGVIYYQLITGVQPFQGFSAIEILSTKAHDKIAPPELHLPDLPAPVRRVLGKLLEKDRDARYPTAVALVEELTMLLAGGPVRAGEPKLWGRPRALAPTVQAPSSPELVPWNQEPASAGTMIVTAVSLLVALGILTWGIDRHNNGGAPIWSSDESLYAIMAGLAQLVGTGPVFVFTHWLDVRRRRSLGSPVTPTLESWQQVQASTVVAVELFFFATIATACAQIYGFTWVALFMLLVAASAFLKAATWSRIFVSSTRPRDARAWTAARAAGFQKWAARAQHDSVALFTLAFVFQVVVTIAGDWGVSEAPPVSVGIPLPLRPAVVAGVATWLLLLPLQLAALVSTDPRGLGPGARANRAMGLASAIAVFASLGLQPYWTYGLIARAHTHAPPLGPVASAFGVGGVCLGGIAAAVFVFVTRARTAREPNAPTNELLTPILLTGFLAVILGLVLAAVVAIF